MKKIATAFGINAKGERINLKGSIGWEKLIDCTEMNLVELSLSEDVNLVVCKNNSLKSLKLHEGLNYLSCDKDLFDYDTCNVKHVHIRY